MNLFHARTPFYLCVSNTINIISGQICWGSWSGCIFLCRTDLSQTWKIRLECVIVYTLGWYIQLALSLGYTQGWNNVIVSVCLLYTGGSIYNWHCPLVIHRGETMLSSLCFCYILVVAYTIGTVPWLYTGMKQCYYLCVFAIYWWWHIQLALPLGYQLGIDIWLSLYVCYILVVAYTIGTVPWLSTGVKQCYCLCVFAIYWWQHIQLALSLGYTQGWNNVIISVFLLYTDSGTYNWHCPLVIHRGETMLLSLCFCYILVVAYTIGTVPWLSTGDRHMIVSVFLLYTGGGICNWHCPLVINCGYTYDCLCVFAIYWW